MPDVVSLGSVNVDRTWYLPAERIRDLEARSYWFPAAGETVRVEGSPDLPAGVLEDARYRTAVGGKGSNQAVAAARAGADAAFLGCVGRDEAEYGVRETLAERGVAVDDAATVDRETGKAYVFVDDGGESWIAIVGGANDAVDEGYVDRVLERIRAADALLLQNEIPVATTDAVLERLEARGSGAERPTVVINPAPADGAAPLLARSAVDVVVVNEAEYAALESCLADIEATVVRTRGPDDVLVENAGGVTGRVTPPTVDAVDATGAGDAFCGYLATLLGDGEGLERAVEVATVAGSLTTETEGVQGAIPDREAVERARSLDFEPGDCETDE
ncbi:PfkB family carbohydrate kinase [Haloterrigena alkaliphila]|uniref:Ribokinase n=1 Tax=Haloterrigena alkaliphila TaxID=2816475 RepID=A0A8A2VFF1_9EURY|nr:PfkB family carbohydrate kinase [Haloterrigena alkaliphila]QSX00242.1 PfkB family carbohydrate kinase [Haloterrigena alkaliphila]